MTGLGGIGGRYYRLGLAAAKRRDLGAALRYASFARILEPGHEGAERLAEICRHELGLCRASPVEPQKIAGEAILYPPDSLLTGGSREPDNRDLYGPGGAEIRNRDGLPGEAIPERIGLLAGQKKWQAAAKAAKDVPHQSVRLLNIQGCLWALAKRYEQAADCFAKVLEKDRGNTLAPEALAEIGRRWKRFGRFFCFSFMK
ncbi:MAG: hypothetical protein LBT87_00720 [Treponema sp.]|jgi:tetratricopeptide (TPR) repeat protein|nr:hypothetical protein [Treponema sp.]